MAKAGQAGVADWLQYAALRGAEALLRVIPLPMVARIGRGLGWLAYWVAGPYRRLALSNLRIAFGTEMDEKKRRSLARTHFSRLGGNLLCGFKLPLMPTEEVMKTVELQGEENLVETAASGRSMIYVVGHLSCWELLAQVPIVFSLGRTPGSVYQALGNPLLNRLVLDRRQKLGYQMFDRAAGFAGPVRFLREGGCLGVLVDQHAGDQGVWCPFFGRLASTTPLPALLARRTNTVLESRAKAVLLPVSVHDTGPGRWRLRCMPPLEAGFGGRDIEHVTARLNEIYEGMIREDPADWFWVHNRWKTPNPNFLLSGYRRGVVLPDGMRAQDLKPFELLVRSPNWLGDACMAFPAVRAMKRGRPDLRLTVLAPEKLRDLWTALPEVDAFIGKEGGESLWAVSRRIRSSGISYDAAILLTNSTRSTLELRLVGIPHLAGFRGSLRQRWLHQVCPDVKPGEPPLHHARKYLRLAEHAGADISPADLWQTGRPTTGAAGPLRLGLCAGAEYGPAKRWPLERFAQMANQIASEWPERQIEWLLFGAPGEAEMGRQLSEWITVPHQNRIGKTSLKQLIAELQTCRLLVTNDTGTMHLAAALGVPTVSIFGSTEPSLTGPLGNSHRVIRNHVACSPCFKRQCPFGHYRCMTSISVEQVSEQVRAALLKTATVTAAP